MSNALEIQTTGEATETHVAPSLTIERETIEREENPMTATKLDQKTERAIVAALDISYVPEVDPLYVPFGHYDKLEKVLLSGTFYPCYITGLAGNGKSHMVDQLCAKHNREKIRVNITAETDEDDLLGGYRLVGGDTVWQDGPVVEAMKRGAVLLLDEVDLGDSKIMCLQGVLEGKTIQIKKTGAKVTPADGFTVFATANTKGKGTDSGSFAHTQIQNEAFLDRFPMMVEQDYPSEKVEANILRIALETYKQQKDGTGVNPTDESFISNVCKWTRKLRESFMAEAIDDVVSTRRAIDMMKSYTIFGDTAYSVRLGVTRFDDETKEEMIRLYKMFDDKTKQAAATESALDAAMGAANKGKSSSTSSDAKAKIQNLLRGSKS